MSDDESELRYIRCPECRSLIPADARSCRMCGAAVADSSDGTQTPGVSTPVVGKSKSVNAASVWLSHFYSDGPFDVN